MVAAISFYFRSSVSCVIHGYSFTLVTFKAACKFISSVPAGQLQHPLPKEIDQVNLC